MTDDLGRAAFEAYRDATTAPLLAGWAGLTRDQQDSWRAAAAAVDQAVTEHGAGTIRWLARIRVPSGIVRNVTCWCPRPVAPAVHQVIAAARVQLDLPAGPLCLVAPDGTALEDGDPVTTDVLEICPVPVEPADHAVKLIGEWK